MRHNNNHNSSCDYGEQMVSYLYGEIVESEKSRFETHLQNCSACADEFAGFVSVHNSIQEWRTEDFAGLSTPAFEMPAVTAMAAGRNGRPPSMDLVDSIRAFWSSFPAWMSAAAAFGVMLVFAGLFWLASPTTKNTELAGNTNEASKTPSFPSSPTAAAPEQNSVLVAGDERKDLEKNPEEPFIPAHNKTLPDSPATLRISQPNYRSKAAKPKKSMPEATGRNNDKVLPKAAEKNNIPSLAIEEDEDKSLRLSDILEEVSLN